MKIQIKTSLLKAALICAPKNDSRYYLNGIFLEVRGDTVTAVATDGHILFCGQDQMPEASPIEIDVIIPRETVYAALRGHKDPSIELEYNNEEVLHRLGSTLFKEIDGKYPDWRKVIPEKVSGEPANYDPRLLATAHKALAAANGVTPAKLDTFVLHQNGSDDHGMNCAAIAQVEASDVKAFCVVTPRRTDHKLDISWLK